MFTHQPAPCCPLSRWVRKSLALVRLVTQEVAQVARAPENSLWRSPGRHPLGRTFQKRVVTGENATEKGPGCLSLGLSHRSVSARLAIAAFSLPGWLSFVKKTKIGSALQRCISLSFPPQDGVATCHPFFFSFFFFLIFSPGRPAAPLRSVLPSWPPFLSPLFVLLELGTALGHTDPPRLPFLTVLSWSLTLLPGLGTFSPLSPQGPLVRSTLVAGLR